MTRPNPWMPGERLGSYEVLAKLGEGGMGEVYRAQPRWSQAGNEIFFIQQGQGQRLLMAARVEATGPAVKRTEVTSLFPVPVRVATPGSLYVPSKDDQRFLIITAGSTDRLPTTTPIVVIDWPALRRESK